MLLFGSDSQMKVHITPASDESTTVEQHLRAECEMLMQRVQVSLPAHPDVDPCQGDVMSPEGRLMQEMARLGLAWQAQPSSVPSPAVICVHVHETVRLCTQACSFKNWCKRLTETEKHVWCCEACEKLRM